MGAGASVPPDSEIPKTTEEARQLGFSDEEIEVYKEQHGMLRARKKERSSDATDKTTEQIADGIRTSEPPKTASAESHTFVSDLVSLGNFFLHCDASSDWVVEPEFRTKALGVISGREKGVPLEQLCSRCSTLSQVTDAFDRGLEQLAVDWVKAAMQELIEGSTDGEAAARRLDHVKVLLGNAVFATRSTLLNGIKTLANEALTTIAEEGERMFVAEGLGESLGKLGEAHFGEKVRLDTVKGVGLDTDIFKRIFAREQLGGCNDFFMLQFLHAAADHHFQVKVKSLVEATGGRWKAAPSKTGFRMDNKKKNDHRNEKEPKVCANIDGVRGGATYDDPESIRRGFEAVSDVMPLLRCKNTFDPAFDAKEKTYGYRCILANCLIREENLTWGQVLDSAETKMAWQAALDDLIELGAPPKKLMEGIIEPLATNEELRALPFAQVGLNPSQNSPVKSSLSL